MAATTPPSIKKLLPLIFLIFAILLATAFATSPRLVAKLIHRDSIHSPYHNPNATAVSYGRAKREFKSSIARFAYLFGAKITNGNDYRAGVLWEEAGMIFLANISIGEPPVVQLLIMDTGSSLLWLQCLPCTQCYKQSVPIFDPSKSSTYANISCHSHHCFDETCDSSDYCLYTMGYYDGASTYGNLANEKLTFETSDEGTSSISNIIVGCGHENDEKDAPRSGVLGLGPEDMSLVFRLGSKFSYCISDLTDTHNAFNHLIIGEGAKIEGNSSPLEIYRQHYYVALEGISVGIKRLKIDPNIFKKSLATGDGGVIIDSGSSLSFLAKGAFEPLRDEVNDLLQEGFEPVQDASEWNLSCYKGNATLIKGFPLVTFYFSGGAKLVLDEKSLFYQDNPNQYCLSVAETPSDMTSSLIGVMAQQSYNIAYNLDDKTISFLKIDCQLLK